MPGMSSSRSAAALTASATAANFTDNQAASPRARARPGTSPGASVISTASANSSKKKPATINDTGVTRNARPAKSPNPLISDRAAAVQECAKEAGSTPATKSLWSATQTNPSKARVSASVFQRTARNGG